MASLHNGKCFALSANELILSYKFAKQNIITLLYTELHQILLGYPIL